MPKSRSKVRRRKERREIRPLSSAGLISFYEEFEGRIKVKPHVIIAMAVLFTLVIVLLRFLIPL
ncbi:MAG TPA: preprotein translocase subunit Sec61beta [Acidilobales archaeon]|nr:preprotein translocase subunit Sec61beta [Acidilobales archaeon]